MQYRLGKIIPCILGLLLLGVWASSVAADSLCAEITKIVAQSDDFASLKGEAVIGERFKAKTQIKGFLQCTVTPFGKKFSYTCETAPGISEASALKRWTALKGQLENCLKGNWLQRNAGKHNAFFADRKKGEALSLSMREVAGFKRVGNQLKTFPTYYNRLSVFPHKKMKKKKAN